MKVKKRIRLKKKPKVILVILIILICLYVVIHTLNDARREINVEAKEIIIQKEKPANEAKNDELEDSEETEEEMIEEGTEEIIEEPTSYTTRMTSYYANDGYETGHCTGSGLCTWDFGVNEHGWYTYNGKLVVATATTYLANQGWYVADGVHLYKYGDELTLTIDGVEYDAIVKDSCGHSMKSDRVDLFVSNAESVKDTMIEVRMK